MNKNLKFERGKSAKSAMGIGAKALLANRSLKNVVAPYGNSQRIAAEIASEFGLPWNEIYLLSWMDEGDEKLNDILDPEITPSNMVNRRETGAGVDSITYETKFGKIVREYNDVETDNLWGTSEVADKMDLIGLIKESVGFERGQSPKKGMGIGVMNRYEDFRVENVFKTNGGRADMGRFQDLLDILGEWFEQDPNDLYMISITGVNKDLFNRVWELLEKSKKLDERDLWPDAEMPEKLYLVDTKDGLIASRANHKLNSSQQFATAETMLKIFDDAGVLSEDVNFERGKDPKDVMGIGIEKILINSFNDMTGIDLRNATSWDWEVDEIQGNEIYIIGYNQSLGKKYYALIPDDIISGVAVDTPEEAKASLWKRMKEYEASQDKKIWLKESVNFERGKDPKEAMRVGVNRPLEKGDRVVLLSYRTKLPVDSGTVLRIQKNRDIVIDVDGHSQPEVVYNPSDVIRESVRFERGKDPKDSMGIGQKEEIRQAMNDFMSSRYEILGMDIHYSGSNQSPRPKLHVKYIGHEFGYPTWQECVEKHLGEYVDFDLGQPGNPDYYFTIHPEYIKVFEEIFKEDDLKESVNFKRGKDPKSAMGLGLENDIRNGFKELRDEGINFAVIHSVPNPEKLKGDTAAIMSRAYRDRDAEHIADYLRFVFPQAEVFHNPIIVPMKNLMPRGSEIYLPIASKYEFLVRKAHGRVYESIRFERGQGPKEAMGVGLGEVHMLKLDLFKKILEIANDPDYPLYLDDDILGDPKDISKVGDIYGISSDRKYGKIPYEDLEWLNDWLGRWEDKKEDSTDVLENIKFWSQSELEELEGLHESVRFERGRDPKEALNIGRNKKWKVGDKVQIYNALEDDYWNAIVTAESEKDDTGYEWGATVVLEDGTNWPITFNGDFNEWMIDE